jgi:hypothetical protein
LTTYPNAAALLADARQRLRKLGTDFGILIVEGGDESKVLRRFCTDSGQIIPAGGKMLALQAYQHLRPGEEERIIFFVDCDYDVPTGNLAGDRNLILTSHPAFEVDLLEIDEIIVRALESLLPYDRYGGVDFHEVACEVRDRAVAMAEAVGRLRWTARHHGLKLNFDLDFSRYREAGTAQVDESRLVTDLLRHSGRCSLSEHQVRGFANGLPHGLISTHGHDLLAAVEDVMIRDLGTGARIARSVAATVRAVVTAADLQRLEVFVRVRRWEESTNRRIFAGPS